MCLRFWNLWATGTNKKYRKGALTRKLRQLKYAVTVSKTPFLSSHKSLSLREK